MRPTFLAFQTASRAMAAFQTNIDVTGNNISNVNTPNYTRQRVDQSAISTSGFTQKYSLPGVTEGVGVEVTNISQIRDPFLDARFRTQNAESGKYDTILEGLSDLENIFDEADKEGLQKELSNFLNQLQTLSQAPTTQENRFIVRTAAQKVTQMLNVYARQTQEVRDQNIKDLSNVVINNDFNAKVKSIANLNRQIREEQTHGNTPNDLLDTRNGLIDELSNMANIKVTIGSEKISEDLSVETMTISLYDSTKGTTIPIVSKDLYNTLSTRTDNTTGEVRIDINSTFGNPPAKDITDYMTGGTIRGYLDIINGKGSYAAAGENDFRGTLYYQKTMDTFALNFAHTFNSLNGNGDHDSKMLFTDSTGGTSITAANIRVSQAWLNDADYITTTTAVPAAGAADNVLRMISAMKDDTSFVTDPFNDTTPGTVKFSGSFSEYVAATIGTLALDGELNQNFADTSTTVVESLSASREAIMGVNMDEEGIKLMAYQKSYNAAARYFTVLDEAVDTLVNKMGLVGR